MKNGGDQTIVKQTAPASIQSLTDFRIGTCGKPMPGQDIKIAEDGEILNVGNIQIKVIHTPGHTAGSCCYYLPEEEVLFSGDTLFAQSVGRTDFPGGSSAEIVRSLHKLVDTLPEDTEVFPGHDASTTIGYEKRYNPFV